jgi:hypothetical protein
VAANNAYEAVTQGAKACKDQFPTNTSISSAPVTDQLSLSLGLFAVTDTAASFPDTATTTWPPPSTFLPAVQFAPGR